MGCWQLSRCVHRLCLSGLLPWAGLFLGLLYGSSALGAELRPYRTSIAVSGLSEHLSIPAHKQKYTKRTHDTIEAISVRGRAHALGRFDLKLDSRRNLFTDEAQHAGIVKGTKQVSVELLQGSIALGGGLRRRGNSRVVPAAAAIVGGFMIVDFIGRKRSSRARSRAYSLRVKLSHAEEQTASLASIAVNASTSKHCDSSVENVNAERSSYHAEESSGKQVDEESGFTSYDLVRVITLSTDADPEWYARYGAESTAQIARIVNAAEMLYLRKIGLGVSIHAQHVYTDSSPYTSSDAGTLLSQFVMNKDNSKNLAASPELYELEVDAKHLFTGKELSGSAVGIAYIGSVCLYPTLSFGLTQATHDYATISVFAHELSHNLGAYHDVNSPGTLMYPALGASGASGYSARSAAEVQKYLASNAACLSFEERQSPTPPNIEVPPIPTADPDGREESGVISTDRVLKVKARILPGKVQRIAIRTRVVDGANIGVSGVGVELYRSGRLLAVERTEADGRAHFLLSLAQSRRRSLTLTARVEDDSAAPRAIRVSTER